MIKKLLVDSSFIFLLFCLLLINGIYFYSAVYLSFVTQQLNLVFYYLVFYLAVSIIPSFLIVGIFRRSKNHLYTATALLMLFIIAEIFLK